MSQGAITTAVPGTVSAEEREALALERERPPLIGEDWLAVLVGGSLIALVLSGLRPVLARFAWGTDTATAAALLGEDNLARSAQMATLVLGPIIVGAAVLRARMQAFVPAVLLLYALGWLAQALAGHAVASAWGLEYVLFGLAVGLAINHSVTLPAWFREAVRTEYYIKTGLVVLGATILFDEIVGAGFLGILQALVVVISVWTFCFWLAKRLRVDDELATMLSSAVSICGVSAAIATCGAIEGGDASASRLFATIWTAPFWRMPAAVKESSSAPEALYAGSVAM